MQNLTIQSEARTIASPWAVVGGGSDPRTEAANGPHSCSGIAPSAHVWLNGAYLGNGDAGSEATPPQVMAIPLAKTFFL